MTTPKCEVPSNSCPCARRWSIRLKRWLWICDCSRAFPEESDGTPSATPLRGDVNPEIGCPKCGAPMALITGSRNGDFWSCSKFPTCTGTRQPEQIGAIQKEGLK